MTSKIIDSVKFEDTRPLLCTCFSDNGEDVFAGGLSNHVNMLPLNHFKGGATIVTKHDAPVKTIKYLPLHGGLIARYFMPYNER